MKNAIVSRENLNNYIWSIDVIVKYRTREYWLRDIENILTAELYNHYKIRTKVTLVKEQL